MFVTKQFVYRHLKLLILMSSNVHISNVVCWYWWPKPRTTFIKTMTFVKWFPFHFDTYSTQFWGIVPIMYHCVLDFTQQCYATCPKKHFKKRMINWFIVVTSTNPTYQMINLIHLNVPITFMNSNSSLLTSFPPIVYNMNRITQWREI